MNDLEEILSGEDGAVEAEQPQSDVVESTDAATESTEEAIDTTGEQPAEEAADASPASEEARVEDKTAIQVGLEAELARIRAKNRELEERMSQAQQPEERPDFFEDPDAALNAIEQRQEQKLEEARIAWSVQSARHRHEDFDEKSKVFDEMLQQNPALWDQMRATPDPAEFAYRTADQTLKMREFGDIKSFEDKVRADERTKAEARIKAEYEARLKELSGLPQPLADTRAAGGNSSPPVTNDALEDILGR